MLPPRRLTLARAFLLVASVTGTAVLGAGWAVTVAEPERFEGLEEGLWWAIATITTVGYGDYVPVSAAGRLIGAALMLTGIAALAFVTATMASLIVGRVEAEEELLEREESELLAAVAEINERLGRLEQDRERRPGEGVKRSVTTP
jgi:voltage-gated potassium channel